MNHKTRLLMIAALFVLALPLIFTGTASAKYMSDGSGYDGTAGVLVAPTDGVCVKSLAADGTMVTIPGVTNKRDCDAQIFAVTAATTGDTLASVCGTPSKNTDGVKYAAPGSNNCVTIDGSGYITGGLSMVNLDRGAVMCNGVGGQLANATAPTTLSNGATITVSTKTVANGTSAMCTAYGWQYRYQDASGTPIALNSVSSTTTGNGFCYTTVRTGVAAVSCPSTLTGTTLAISNSKYGYSVSGGNCLYAYGTSGVANAALTKIDGTAYAAAGATVDLRSLTQGQCLADGASWSNGWGFVTTGNDPSTADGWTSGTGVKFDQSRQALNGDEGCLHCHSYTSQQNGPAERFKDSYLKTGHRNMLRKVTPGSIWKGPDGVTYTTDGTNTIDFVSGTVTGPVIGTKTLTYIYGDWMAALPSLAYPGANYGCAGCHATGYNDSTNPGVQKIGISDYAGTQPADAGTDYVASVAAGNKWDLEGIQCGRCHNATVPAVTAAQIAASTFTTTYPTSTGMGNIPSGPAAMGTYSNFLCIGCHQSIAKLWPAQGGAAAGTTQYDPTLIPTGVSHGAAAGRDFNGHVLGMSFLNSVHAKYNGVNSNTAAGGLMLNSLGKYDLISGGTYGSTFQGFTCWQGSASSSPAKTKADGTEIKDKATCEGLYGAGAWRTDTQGSCTTCHDVHNSLFVEEQAEKAIKKECVDCHANADYAAAVPAAPQYVDNKMVHPRTAGTPWDATLYGSDPCAVCHMATQAEKNGNQTSMPVHLWRISTDANYNTFPTADQFNGTNGAVKDRNAQTAADGAYTNAVWVDLDLACGQCHGGSLGITANGAPLFDKTQLAGSASKLHDGGDATGCLSCHNTTQGTYRAVVQGTNHHNGSCTTCHQGKQHQGTPVMPVPTLSATVYKPAGSHNPLPYWSLSNNSIQISCQTCHSSPQIRSADGSTIRAIAYTGTGKNHHNGHSGVPGTAFGGVSVANGSRGDDDPGMYCLGCHGKSTIVSGNNSVGYQLTIAASGLKSDTVGAQAGLTPPSTTGLCLGCHSDSVVQSGTGQNHHAGDCLTCHNPQDPTALWPGIAVVPAAWADCSACHGATPMAGTISVVQSGPTRNHHAGACTECHAEAGVPAMPAPNYTLIAKSGKIAIDTSIQTSCLTCHSTTQTRSADSSTIGAIVPSGTGDNHHNGHAYIPGQSGTDPGLYCLGCHGSASVVAPVVGSTYKITSAGLSAALVSVQKGMLPNVNNTPGINAESVLCVQCHSNVDSGHGSVTQEGANKNHHSGSCTSCHSAYGSYANGNLPAGVASIPGGVNCTIVCHTVEGSSMKYAQMSSLTCDQCHTSAGVLPKLTPPSVCSNCHAGGVYDSYATNMHLQSPTASFGVSKSGMNVNVDGSSSTCPSGATCSYDCNWGDGSAHGASLSGSHTYAAGTFTITLTVSNGLSNATASQSVTIAQSNRAPAAAFATGSPSLSGWTASVTDASTDPDNNLSSISVVWGDGATSRTTPGGTVTHTYTTASTYTIKLTATDASGLSNTASASAPISISLGTVTGTVTIGGLPAGSAKVQLTRVGGPNPYVYTNASGVYSITNVKPGAVTITATKGATTLGPTAVNVTSGTNTVNFP